MGSASTTHALGSLTSLQTHKRATRSQKAGNSHEPPETPNAIASAMLSGDAAKTTTDTHSTSISISITHIDGHEAQIRMLYTRARTSRLEQLHDGGLHFLLKERAHDVCSGVGFRL
jgi:hypothetical protein